MEVEQAEQALRGQHVVLVGQERDGAPRVLDKVLLLPVLRKRMPARLFSAVISSFNP